MSKFLHYFKEGLKWGLKGILYIMPESVIREYAGNEKFIKKACTHLKATLNNIPALGQTKVDDHIIDYAVEPILLKLSGLIKNPSNENIKWVNENGKELEKLAK
jgi:hypothetical protein